MISKTLAAILVVSGAAAFSGNFWWLVTGSNEPSSALFGLRCVYSSIAFIIAVVIYVEAKC